MPKFTNTNYSDKVTNITNAIKDKVTNPYYVFTNEKATPIKYFNINRNKSSVDGATKLIETDIGPKSPLRFNMIDNLIVYGLPKIEINLQNGEWGIESDTIEGEFKLPPGSIEPSPNDFFIIPYLKQDLLFKVTNVNVDTIDNGSNIHLVSYKLDKTSAKSSGIYDQVVEEYVCMIEHIGTNNKTIIKKEDHNLLTKIDSVMDTLKIYYRELFYNPRVDTFIFYYNGFNFYDSILIEFLIRYKLINYGEEYLYVTHQVNPGSSLNIDYMRSFFAYFETPNKKPLGDYLSTSVGEYIDTRFTTFNTRQEDYFKLKYRKEGDPCYISTPIIYNLDKEFINEIDNNIKDNIKLYRNIIIKYYNNEDVTTEDLKYIDTVDYDNNICLFYELPLLIYVLDCYASKLISLTSN